MRNAIRTGCIVLIDGYNVIKKHPSWRHSELDPARRALLAGLTAVRWPIPASEIIVFFDSRSERDARVVGPQVRVVFAPSADDAIADRIRAHPNPERLLVISSDGDIRAVAKHHGARWQPTPWLLDRCAAPSTRADRRPASSTRTHVNPVIARRITEELKRHLGISDDREDPRR